jgi:hypothetical protein
MSACKWCGVERDAPAAGPHACDPQRVRDMALEDAAQIVDEWRAYVRSSDMAVNIRAIKGAP